MPSPKCQQICGILLAAIGLLILIVTLSGQKPLITYIDNLIKTQVHLSPGTETYDNWQTPPVPIYDDIYLFNITNPIEFNKGEKAILEPVGPYVYQKYEIKKQANFSGDLKYAMYYDYEYFVFSESETQKHNNNTSLNDVIFIPNVPLLTVVSQIAHNSLIPAAVKTTLEELVAVYEHAEGLDYLTLNGTVQDILWGMNDPIMSLLHSLKLAPSPQFALQTNGSTDANAMKLPTVVYTGHTDISKVDEYHLFHGRNSSDCWGSNAANTINGTEGSMFEPLLIYNKTKSLTIYNEQLFRSVDLEFTNESSYEGIDCYEYRIPDWALQNVTNNPTNVAYYAWKYSGMLNLTACAQNVPLYLTKAMFLDADVRIRENITLSVQANRTLHDTFLCVEPYTGVVVNGHKRVQINVQMEHHSTTGILNETQPAFIPLITVDEHGSITPDLADKLKSALLVPIHVMHIGFYLLCAFGTGLVLVSVIIGVVIVSNKCRQEEEEDKEVLVPAEEEETDNKSGYVSDNSDQYLSLDAGTSRYYEASE